MHTYDNLRRIENIQPYWIMPQTFSWLAKVLLIVKKMKKKKEKEALKDIPND